MSDQSPPCSSAAHPSIALNRLSNNVGPCQALVSTAWHALREERNFALLDGVAFPTVGWLVIALQVRNSVRPMHLFGRDYAQNPGRVGPWAELSDTPDDGGPMQPASVSFTSFSPHCRHS